MCNLVIEYLGASTSLLIVIGTKNVSDENRSENIDRSGKKVVFPGSANNPR